MSSIGQGNDRGGGSHKIFLSWLKEMGTFNDKVGKCKLRYVHLLSFVLGVTGSHPPSTV
jgi:25S rRNA (adenine2142-N1)-methyltransferase